MRQGENNDVALKNLNTLIRSGFDFAGLKWEDVEIDAVETEKAKQAEDFVEDDYVEGERDIQADEKEVTDLNAGDKATSSKKRKNLDGEGAETRKMKLLCERTTMTNAFDYVGMKRYIKKRFENFFKQFGQEVGNRLEKIENDVATLKEVMTTIASLREAMTTTAGTSSIEKQPSIKTKAVVR